METNGSILDKFRAINKLMQESTDDYISMEDLCERLSEILDSNVYIADNDGVILGMHFSVEEDSATRTDPLTGELALPDTYADELAKIDVTTANLRNEEVLAVFKYEESTKQKVHTIIPIICGGQRWGSMILARYEPAYDEVELVLCELASTLVGFEIQRAAHIRETEEAQRLEVVQMALNSLSYSEYEAVIKIFEELDGEEGILVASKVADRSRITRSVIVNALRKLESAGVIESKSLGMKGTHIKVMNDKFLPAIELDK